MSKYNRLLIVFYTISPLTSYIFVEILNIETNFISIVLSILGVILFFVLNDKSRRIRIPTYLIFYFLFTLYLFFSAFVLHDKDFKISYIYGSSYIGAVCLLFIIENMVITKKYYDIIFKISKYTLILAFFVILYQELVNPTFWMYTYREVDQTVYLDRSEYRLKSIFSYLGYNSFGLIFLPMLLWIIESLDRKKKNVMKWVLVGLIYVFIAKARWLMVNSITIFVLLVLKRKYKIFQSVKYGFYLILFLFLGYSTLNLVNIDVDEIIEKRILESDKGSRSSSAGTRLFAFEVFGKVFWDEPVFGAGDQKYGMGGTGQHNYNLRKLLGKRTAQIHVGYLSLFYKFGLVGGFFFVGFIISLIKSLYKTAKNKNVWTPFLAVLGFALINLTQVNFSFFEVGLIIVLFVNRYYIQPQSAVNKIEKYAY